MIFNTTKELLLLSDCHLDLMAPWLLHFPVVTPRQVESPQQLFLSLSQHADSILHNLVFRFKVETYSCLAMTAAYCPREMWPGPAIRQATAERSAGEEGIQRQC